MTYTTNTCTACHTPLAPDVRFCPHCGAAVPIATMPSSPSPVYPVGPAGFYPTRVSRHLQALGVLWLIYAFERTLSKAAGLMFLHGLFGNRFHTHSSWGSDWSPFGSMGMESLWPVIAVSLAVGLVLSLITAYALMTRQPWGRVFAIVIAILALFHPVLGTALGIYTLWVLAPGASGAEYDAIARGTVRV